MIYIGILLLTILIWLCYEWLEHSVINYNSTTVECDKLSPNTAIKLCVLADLHNNKKNCEKICAKIKEFHPDYILVPGDMVNKHRAMQKNAVNFLNNLAQIAPVCYSLGNHEERIRVEKNTAWENFICSLSKSVILLDNTSVTQTAQGNNITFSGLSLPKEFYCKGKLWDNEENLPELPAAPEGFHILLAHNPEYAAWYKKYRPDFVVSGHLHGGLLRLPFFGGMISPRLRIPKEDAGAYRYPFGILFITRGLGSHTVPLRFFNRTEINFIVLRGEK